MSLCNNCYHNKVCEYKSCDKEDCSHYKNENLIAELPLEIGTPYYRIETKYHCTYGEKCEIELNCILCSYYKERLEIVRYVYRPTLFTNYESLGKIYLSKEEAEKALREEQQND